MEVSLEQAIEIHARVLRRIHGQGAPFDARRRADQLAAAGDASGYQVWLDVAQAAEKLIDQEPKLEWPPQEHDGSIHRHRPRKN